MFCRYCGHSQPDDSVFCSKCGKAIAEIGSKGGLPNSPTDRPAVEKTVERRPPAWPRVATGFTILGYEALASMLWSVFALIVAAVPSMKGWLDSSPGSVVASIVTVVFGVVVVVGLGYLQQSSRKRATVARVASILTVINVVATFQTWPFHEGVALLCGIIVIFLIIVYIMMFAKQAGERSIRRSAFGLLLSLTVGTGLIIAAGVLAQTQPKSPAAGILALVGLTVLIVGSVWQVVLYFQVARLLRKEQPVSPDAIEATAARSDRDPKTLPDRDVR